MLSTVEQQTKLNRKIIRQVEFYFGDENVQVDTYLQNDWISLGFLLTFKRLQRLTTEKDVVVAALKDSKIVDISEDHEKIRRKPHLTIPLLSPKEKRARTAYIEGFPLDTTFDEILEFFEKYDEIGLVSMDNCCDCQKFKGGVFAKFKDEEFAEKFVKLESFPTFKNIELVRMMRRDYRAKRVAQKSLQKQRDNKNIAEDNDDFVVIDNFQAHICINYIKGLVLHVSGLPTNVGVDKIKAFFNNYASVFHVHHPPLYSEATIQFEPNEPFLAVEALKKIKEAAKENDGKILFHGKEIQCFVLQGKEEKKYWADFCEMKKEASDAGNQGYGCNIL